VRGEREREREREREIGRGMRVRGSGRLGLGEGVEDPGGEEARGQREGRSERGSETNTN
jgi:hypothetical protein